MQALHQSRAHFDSLDDYDEIFLHVYAPTLVEYTKWIIRSAEEQNIKRLYFLARDSWLPYQIACHINKVIGAGIDIKYISVSRFALRNAEYAFIGKKALESICVGGIDITFTKLMRRACLTDEEIRTVALDIGFENRLEECLSFAQINEVKAQLYKTENIFEFIKSHSNEYYENARRYFVQEGFFDDIRYAIVDSGWLGTTQKSLQRFLSHISNRKIELSGFYFGLYELPSVANEQNYHSYYLKPNIDIDRKVRFSICLYETLVSAPVGMTLGYKQVDDRMEPVVNTLGNPNTEKMYRNKKLINEYISEITFNAETMQVDDVLMIEKLLMLSMGKPTKTEARTMGSLRFCDDVLESGMKNVARKWNRVELFKQSFFLKLLFKFLKSRVKLHESGWPEGSIVNLCGEGIGSKLALINERMYKRGMYIRKSLKAS